MVSQYKAVTARTSAWRPRQEAASATPYDVLIVASIIEREVSNPNYGAKVARVLYNRLDKGKKLGLDSTVIYAGNSDQDNDDHRRTGRTSRRTTPTSTRACRQARSRRPASAALEAAANPPTGKWLYFVTVNFDTGETKFAETEAEHQKNVAQFKTGARRTRSLYVSVDGHPGRRGAEHGDRGPPLCGPRLTDRALAVARAAPGGVRRARAGRLEL